MKKILFLLLFPALVHGQRVFDLSHIQQPVSNFPTISPSGSLSTFSTVAGTASADQTFTFTAINLTGNVTWTAASGYQVSPDGATWGPTAVYTQVGGNASGTVHNRLAAATPAGSYPGSVVGTGGGANPASISCTGTVSGAPTLSASPTSITGLNATAGTAGTPQPFVVTFGNLSGNVTATSFAPVEISKDGGATYALSQIFSTGSPLTIYARDASTATVGAISGNIVFSASGVSNQPVGVTGTVSSGASLAVYNIQLWDSIRNAGKFNNAAYNNWAPVQAVPASLTSAALTDATGATSPVHISVSAINDYSSNGSTAYAASNTMGYPADVFVEAMYNNVAMTFTFTNVPSGTYTIEVVSSAGQGSGPYNSTFTSGAASQSGNAYNNLTTLISLPGLTPTSGTLTFTITPSNGFAVIDHIRLKKTS